LRRRKVSWLVKRFGWPTKSIENLIVGLSKLTFYFGPINKKTTYDYNKSDGKTTTLVRLAIMFTI